MTDRTAGLPSPAHDVINIPKSSELHIGPKFVPVVQTTGNAEKSQGHSMWARSSGWRCYVRASLCLALLFCVALALYISYALLSPRPTRLDIGIDTNWYLRRADWKAAENVKMEFLNLPADYVVITHSAGVYCDNRDECSRTVRVMSKNHIFRGFDDISPNFLVGGNGYVLEGRGANVQGATIAGWNPLIISVMFLGNYAVNDDKVDADQITNLQAVLDQLVVLKILTPDYQLFGACQITNSRNPGPNIQDILHVFPRWNSSDIKNCIRT